MQAAGVVGLGLLYGVTFGALAARLDARVRPMSGGLRTVPAHAPVLVGLLPPFFAATVPYVALRTLLRGRTAAALTRGPVRSVGRVLASVGIVASSAVTLVAAVEIL